MIINTGMYKVQIIGQTVIDGKPYAVLQIESIVDGESKEYYVRRNDLFFRKSEPKYYLPKYENEIEEIYQFHNGAILHVVKKIEEE
mgnify:FL=1